LDDDFKTLDLACPKCGIEKVVRLPLKLFEGKGFGIIKVQVPIGGVCNEHNFMVLVNKKGVVLGYETFDMMVSEASEIDEPRKEIIDEAPAKEEDLDKSSLQAFIDKFGFNCIAGYLHSKLFDYPAYLICSDDIQVELTDMDNIFNQIIPNSYKDSHAIEVIKYDREIYPQPGYYYALAKDRLKHAFIMNPDRHVINSPWVTDIEYEKIMIRNALEWKESNDNFKKLSEFIERFVKDVEITVSFLEDLKKIYEKDLIKKLNKKIDLSTINKSRLRLIREFISKRISPEIALKIIV
jgi:hypothetical protein